MMISKEIVIDGVESKLLRFIVSTILLFGSGYGSIYGDDNNIGDDHQSPDNFPSQGLPVETGSVFARRQVDQGA